LVEIGGTDSLGVPARSGKNAPIEMSFAREVPATWSSGEFDFLKN
jgi:hypothetical protein